MDEYPDKLSRRGPPGAVESPVRVRLECGQCVWAASSTDLGVLAHLSACHERRYPGHGVICRDG